METFSDLPPCWVIAESWLLETLLRGTWSRNPPASEGQSLSSSSSSSPTLCPEQAAGSLDCSSCNIGCLQDRGEGHNLSPVICTDQNPILMNSYDLCFSVRGIKCISVIPKRNDGKCHQKHVLSLKPMPAAPKKNWDMSCLLLGGAHLQRKYSNGTEIGILSHSFLTLELGFVLFCTLQCAIYF